MKTGNYILCFVVFGLVAGLNSCTKKQGPDTPFTKMQGKWKLAKTASDNGAAALVYAPLNKEENWQWTFNADGTGFDIENWGSQAGIKETFSYKVVGDSLWWATSTHDTATYYIEEINSGDMIWTRSYPDTGGKKRTEGYYFIKG